jgi:hypothetical protein
LGLDEEGPMGIPLGGRPGVQGCNSGIKRDNKDQRVEGKCTSQLMAICEGKDWEPVNPCP